MLESFRHISRPFCVAAALATAFTGFAAAQGAATAPDAKQVERGGYLVVIGGCNDCHTPWKMGQHGPEPDMSRMLSGHPQEAPLAPAPKPMGPWIWSGYATNTAFSGPWGVSAAFNLTPDETGLGSWDKDRFVRALRTGKHLGGGRPILPPMPWENYGKMTDEDLAAVFAYLRSIPPVKNTPPDPLPPPAPPVVAPAPTGR